MTAPSPFLPVDSGHQTRTAWPRFRMAPLPGSLTAMTAQAAAESAAKTPPGAPTYAGPVCPDRDCNRVAYAYLGGHAPECPYWGPTPPRRHP